MRGVAGKRKGKLKWLHFINLQKLSFGALLKQGSAFSVQSDDDNSHTNNGLICSDLDQSFCRDQKPNC